MVVDIPRYRKWYSAQDLLQLLQIKPHVLRYWEQTLPIVRGLRDDAGHRRWSAAQVRMLLRIHHMVIRRGISVAAAGDALLREATGDQAHVKAGLEHVRNAMVVLLLKVQSQKNGTNSAPVASEGEYENIPNPEEESTQTARSLLPLVQQNFVPPCTDEWYRSRNEQFPPITLQHSLDSSGDETGGVEVLWTHLSASGSPGTIASVVLRLWGLRRKMSGENDNSRRAVVCCPAGEEPVYTEVFGDTHYVLPIPWIAYRRYQWSSPLAAVLITLATDVGVSRLLKEHSATFLHLWSPDNAHSTPGYSFQTAAASAPPGITVGVVPTPRGSGRLSETMVIDYQRWLPHLADTLMAGRWRFGPVMLAHNRINGTGKAVETVYNEKRYDLWMRDLARLSPTFVTTPPGNRPVPWRGSSWLNQVALVWPELGQ